MTLKQKLNLVILLAIAILLIGCPPFDSKSNVSEETNTTSGDGKTVLLTVKVSIDGSPKIDLSNDNFLTFTAITKNGISDPDYIVVSNNTNIITVEGAGKEYTVTGHNVGTASIVVIDRANGNALGGLGIEVYDSEEEGD